MLRRISASVEALMGWNGWSVNRADTVGLPRTRLHRRLPGICQRGSRSRPATGQAGSGGRAFAKELAKFVNAVNYYVRVPINQNRFDALVRQGLCGRARALVEPHGHHGIIMRLYADVGGLDNGSGPALYQNPIAQPTSSTINLNSVSGLFGITQNLVTGASGA
jgi:hypothetical protein